MPKRLTGAVARCVAVCAVVASVWLFARPMHEDRSLLLLLAAYAAGEATWAFAAVKNQREYSKNPRRPYINEIQGVVGATGVVVRACGPMGQVRVDGELWQAEAVGGDTIPVGQQVTVTDYRGLVLRVELATEGADPVA